VHVATEEPSAERQRNPFFNYKVYFDKSDMENEIFHSRRGGARMAKRGFSLSVAESKLIAFDLARERNLPRHLFVDAGKKPIFDNGTHNGPLFRVYTLLRDDPAHPVAHFNSFLPYI
jgi:hypothetical protein